MSERSERSGEVDSRSGEVYATRVQVTRLHCFTPKDAGQRRDSILHDARIWVADFEGIIKDAVHKWGNIEPWLIMKKLPGIENKSMEFQLAIIEVLSVELVNLIGFEWLLATSTKGFHGIDRCPCSNC